MTWLGSEVAEDLYYSWIWYMWETDNMFGAVSQSITTMTCEAIGTSMLDESFDVYAINILVVMFLD